MTTNKPLISVIMPVYNGGFTIRQAVESVFCQNIPLELLVIDDGSTDQTSEVLSVYRNRPDFHYLKNPHNIGAAASRNRGVQEAHGQYVAFLDADDWWENGKLQIQLDTLHENRSCTLFYRKRTYELRWNSYRQIYPGEGNSLLQGSSET